MKAVVLTSNGLVNQGVAMTLAVRLAALLDRPTLDGVKVAYIGNAGDNLLRKGYLQRSQKFWRELGVSLSQIDLRLPLEQIEQQLRDSHIVYVEGGNTFHLMYELRRSGLATRLQNYPDLIYVGSSAGSIVAGVNIQAAALAWDVNHEIDQTNNRGLALVPFTVWPHYVFGMSLLLFLSPPGQGRHRALFKLKTVALHNGEAIIVDSRNRQRVRL